MNLYHLRAHVLTENERGSTNRKTELGDLRIPGDHILNCMLPQPGSQLNDLMPGVESLFIDFLVSV